MALAAAVGASVVLAAIFQVAGLEPDNPYGEGTILAVAVLVAVLFIRGSVQINLPRFFRHTSVALLALGAKLLLGSVYEFSEVGPFPAGNEVMHRVSGVATGTPGAIITGVVTTVPVLLLLRYRSNPYGGEPPIRAQHGWVLGWQDTPTSGGFQNMGFVTNDKSFSLARGLERLWTDHVVWTRLYIIAAVDDRPEAGQAASRLLKNQDDIGNAIVPIYGDAAGAKLTELLKQHIMIAVDLVGAAKAGDQEKFGRVDAQWSKNAEEIAAFLSGANPYWPQKDVNDLLALHLSLTKDEAVARLQHDYEKDVETFDQILTEILTLADALVAGIVKQFPDKFAA
jgi:hypothetical protein